ncbi:MAG TPA: hypothetical protein VHT91_25190 [Kofleriaceae bacterium]|jgi:hypothetical protein|nr:hypothetical protein [Kofleriaceae bacterium]
MRGIRSICMLGLAAIAAAAAPTAAAPKKKYHFELTAVSAKADVKPEVARLATPRIDAQVRKVFAGHPQLVAKLDGAPDPRSNADAYRRYLTQHSIAGAYLVTVEITEASEVLEPLDDKTSQRLVIRIGIHVLGETVPGRTMGFTGDGKATIKQEVGLKLRDRDREYTWDQAAELAVDDAMKTVFQQLAAPTPRR